MSTEMVEKLLSNQDKKNLIGKLSWKKVVKPRISVVAREYLSRGICSRSFNIEDVQFQEKEVEKNLQVEVDNKGYLRLCNNSDNVGSNFLKRLNLAPDIHSTNVHLEITEDTKLFLEITKDIESNKELLLWFSKDILAIINMPFLTPINITGNKRYRCHKCNEAFEYPNPLKIHLLLSCQLQPIDILWQHILNIIQMSNNANCITKSLENSPQSNTSMRSVSEPPVSAFSPYKKQIQDISNAAPQPLNLSVDTSIPIQTLNPQQRWMDNILDLKMSRSLEEMSSNYAADVELFASNWGKLKHGHLCVYCGKIYSRKYGLKIHIRTHTGYKPLKCKFCLRPFGDPSNLNKHVRLHASGLTPYMCSLCGKVLVRRRDLERHLKSQHVGEDGCSVIDFKETSSD